MAQPKRRVSLDEVLQLVRQLSPIEQVHLIEQVAPDIERALAAGPPAPSIPLLGLVKDLGAAPSTEEIDAARREAWEHFPRQTS